MPAAPTIWIAIPTFRRPGQLRHLLESLAAVVPHDVVQLLVADNDPVGQEGALVAHEMQDDPDYPLPIRILHVPEPGLCSVRNAIVATALAASAMQYLAMIDDDEWPQPGWLDALLAVREMCGADVIGGPVDAHFLRPPPHWAREALVFRAENRPSGATDMLWASNNLLLSRAALERLPAPWFDPRFNRSGGEDLDYLTRLRDAGIGFGWAADARVSEWVPPERVRLGWILSRMWRIGFTETLTRRKHRPGIVGTLTLFGRTLAVFAMRTAGLLALLLPGARRVDIAGQWIKCWGRLYALTGRGSRAYYGAE